MWQAIVSHIPSVGTILIAVLAVIVIAAIYRLNHLLHEKGDPPWKKEPSDKKQKK